MLTAAFRFKAAYAIHAEIHKARPDVLCAAHCHSIYGRAMCATGGTLEMLTQDFCCFFNDHVLYPYVNPYSSPWRCSCCLSSRTHMICQVKLG